MRLYKKPGSWQHLPLALDLKTSPESRPALRAAYSRLKLPRRLDSEQVMADRAMALGVRQLADAIAHCGASGNSTINTPTTVETAE